MKVKELSFLLIFAMAFCVSTVAQAAPMLAAAPHDPLETKAQI
jgi:hypothetical protein